MEAAHASVFDADFLAEEGDFLVSPIQFRLQPQAVFVAENVPSLGYSAYKVSNAAGTAPATGVVAHDLGTQIQIENDSCRLVINKSGGTVASAYDKARSKEMLGGGG